MTPQRRFELVTSVVTWFHYQSVPGVTAKGTSGSSLRVPASRPRSTPKPCASALYDDDSASRLPCDTLSPMLRNMAESSFGPVPVRERIHLVDVLRGFALLGVVLQNISDGRWAHKPASPLDRFANEMLESLTSEKFMPLFAFLFGLGFAIQLERAEKLRVSFAPLYLWREFLLLLIGIGHFILLWSRQDVLINYAVLGAMLLLFRRAKPRTLLVVVVLSLVAGANSDFLAARLKSVIGAGTTPMASHADRTANRTNPIVREVFARAGPVYEQGSYVESVRYRAAVFAMWHSSVYNVIGQYFVVIGNPMAMFLLGLYAGRRRLFHDSQSKGPFFRKLLWTGLALWVIVGQLIIRMIPEGSWHSLAEVIAERGQTVVYVASICLLYAIPAWQRLFTPFSWIGRLGLTNYIGSSLLVATIYSGYGFGLYHRVGLASALLLQLGLYMLQAGLSGLWLHYFQFGPIEWLWRSATWREWQPLRAPKLPTAVVAE